MRHLQAQAGSQGVLYIVAVQSQEESNSETRLTSLWCMGLKQVYKIFDMPLGFEMLGKMAGRLHILIFKKDWKKTWFMSWYLFQINMKVNGLKIIYSDCHGYTFRTYTSWC